MKRTYQTVVAMIALGLFVGLGYAADPTPTGPNVGGKMSTDPSQVAPLNAVKTAGDLADWARANKDPVSLATAAKVLASAGAQPMSDPKKTAQAAPAAPDSSKAVPAKDFTPASLLKEARDMAAGNADQLAAIDAIEKSIATARGAVGGPKVDDDVLAPGAGMVYTITFAGDEPMDIAVVTDVAGAIEFKVYDENGNEITTDYTDHFEITPRWTGPFKIVLLNMTAGYVPYGFATN